MRETKTPKREKENKEEVKKLSLYNTLFGVILDKTTNLFEKSIK